MKKLSKIALASVLALSAFSAPAKAAMMPFPAPVNGVNALYFGDFTVYSLAMLNYYATGSTNAPSGSDPFYLPSTPGHLNDYVVIMTGAGGVDNSEFSSTDNPFNASQGGAQPTFSTALAGEPTPSFTGDNIGTWDMSVAAVRDFLNGQNLFFGFNLNETNGGSSLTGNPQDALAWAQLTLIDLDVGGVADLVFTFDGTNPNPAVQTQTLFQNGGTDWGRIHGQICVASAAPATLIRLGACQPADGPNVTTINQNLGADRTAFALTNETLSDLIYDSPYDIMRINLRMADLNNGYEQLFIFGNGRRETRVSEPAALGLLGLGVLGLALARRRKA